MLLTQELRETIPPLYSQEKNEDPFVFAKFFTPDSNWTWFVTEGQQEEGDYLFFGYVVGQFPEWGYFSLNELENVRGPWGLKIERDVWFTGCRMSDVVCGLTKSA